MPYPIPKAELITTLPSKERFHALLHLVVPFAIGGNIVRSGGARYVSRGFSGMNGLDGGDEEGAVATSDLAVGSLAEVVTTSNDMVKLHLSFGQGEVLSGFLLGEVFPGGVSTTSPVGTGVRHVVHEMTMMTGNAAVSRRVA